MAGRLTGRNIVNGANTFNTSVAYKAGINGSSTGLVSGINNKGVAITYTYDANNNIASYVRGGKTVSYVYDELNQLTRENNQEFNKTITYIYNAGGNITSKREYAYTTGTVGAITKTYTYAYGDTNWKDKMTSFDGKALTYDAIGNPTTYNGWTYSWEQGRQPAGMTKTGTAIGYKYNDNGIRTQKTVNGVVTDYTLFGDKVVVEKTGADTIKYSYDPQGNIVSMNINGTEYFYEFNAQGDIIGLVNTSGVEVVAYVYDSWGKVISTTGTLASTVGAKNPYRYRAYRLDSDTGLYYLQSRYYSSDWGRFLNADASQILGLAQGNLLSANLFAYCLNNPIKYSDPSGHWIQFGQILVNQLTVFMQRFSIYFTPTYHFIEQIYARGVSFNNVARIILYGQRYWDKAENSTIYYYNRMYVVVINGNLITCVTNAAVKTWRWIRY